MFFYFICETLLNICTALVVDFFIIKAGGSIIFFYKYTLCKKKKTTLFIILWLKCNFDPSIFNLVFSLTFDTSISKTNF